MYLYVAKNAKLIFELHAQIFLGQIGTADLLQVWWNPVSGQKCVKKGVFLFELNIKTFADEQELLRMFARAIQLNLASKRTNQCQVLFHFW